MKKKILLIIILLLLGCAKLPPVKNPQFTESNLPKNYRIDHVPYIRQGYKQCFPACLAMMFKFYGKEISFKEMDDWIRGAKGTPTKEAERFCQMKKFNTYVFYDWKGDRIKYFLAQKYPLIAEIQSGAFGISFHVIVLTGYDDEKQVFYINDPARKDKEISYKKFKEVRSLDQPGGQDRYYTLLIWPSE